MDNKTNNILYYSAFERQGLTGYILRATLTSDVDGGNISGDINWHYRNQTIVDGVNVLSWEELCSNCTHSRIDTFVKINSYFAQRDSFPFNSSVESDKIDVYANGKLLGTIPKYISEERITALKQYEFSKPANSNYTIDNYNVMVGTDTVTYTAGGFYEDFYKDLSDKEVPIKEGSGELIDAVNTIWSDMGLKTTSSRVFAGISLMFLLALILFGAFISSGVPVSVMAIGFIELFFMIFLIYIKLLPAWIGFVLVIMTGGIGALIIKSMSG